MDIDVKMEHVFMNVSYLWIVKHSLGRQLHYIDTW